MLKHTFSDFSYAVNIESKKKKHKEVLVCFIYNGVEVLKKVYIPEGKGIAYVFEAKKIIDQEMRDGSLAVYSHKFIYKNRKKGIQPKKVVAAVAKGEKESSVPLAPTKVATSKANAPKEAAPKNGSGKKWLIAGGCVAVVAALVLGTYFLTKSLTSTGGTGNYAVSCNTVGDCEFKGSPTAKKGEKYECTLSPKSSDLSIEVQKVRMSGKELKDKEDYTFDSSNNKLTINKVSGQISISAVTVNKTFDVRFTGSGYTLAGTTQKVKNGEKFTCELTSTAPYCSPIINKITMGSKALEEGTGYSFDGTNLIIEEETKDNILIDANVITTTFNVSCDHPSAIVFVGETTVQKGQDYGCTIESKDPKKAVNIDKVRMGSTELIPGPTEDYHYDKNEKKLHISKRATADISIVVSAVDAFYDVTYVFGPNCEKVSGPDTIEPGATLKCKFKAQDAPRRNTVTGVTIGGRKLDPENEYTFSEVTNELNVTTGATGNVVISVTSYDPGTDKFKATFDAGEDCQAIAEITDITLGSEITANLEVTESVKETKKVHVDAVVMGGIALKEGQQYTFDPAASPNFKVLSVTNNVLIKFSAIDIGMITATPVYEKVDDHFVVNEFELPLGKSASDVESITIDAKHDSNGNADTLPVTEIAKGALNNFTNLKELSIPFIGAKYLEPGEKTPMDGTQLFGHIFGDTPHAGSSATWQYYYDEAGVQHPRKFIIPSTLRYVTITGDNTVIPAGAFSGCRDILNIEFTSNTVSTIQNSAFQNCGSLRDIIIPSGVTMIQDCAFQNCTDLKSIDLPLGLTTIGRYAFDGCTGFSRIFLNDSITVVGESAFSGVLYGVIACSKTKTDVDKIDTWSKNWVDDVTTVIYGALNTDDYISPDNFHYMLVNNDDGDTGAFVAEYLGDSAAKEITIPLTVDNKDTTDVVESYPIFGLGNNMFAEYTATEKFVFNCTKLTSIGSYCFNSCTALTSLEGFDKLTELKEIGAYAFAACLKLSSLESLPASVETIGEYALAGSIFTEFDLSACKNLKELSEGVFYACTKMTEITLPEGITYLGDSLFEECIALESLTINTVGIDTIPYAFFYCKLRDTAPALTSFTWESSTPLKAISGSAFGGCTMLSEFIVSDGTTSTTNTIPNTVTNFGDYAFVRCSSITQLYIPAASPAQKIEMGLEVFKGWTGSQTLRISTSLVSGEGIAGTEATTNWGWNLSRGISLDWYRYNASASGSETLVIWVNG